MKIPIAKPFLDAQDAQSAYDAVLSGWVTQGPRVAEFEEKFARYVGSPYAVAVSSCTAALHLSLIAAGIRPGDEVICPSMSFIATANSILYVGAQPVFAEVEPSTYNLDPQRIEPLITERTKAILLVHQMGLPADIAAFSALAKRHRLQLIEDAACAVGSAYRGKKIGSHSELVCFSFHPRKVITTGEGGMITTTREEHYKRLTHLRHHGMSISDQTRHLSSQVLFEDYLELGFNYRMTDIQASVGIRQLEKLDGLVEARRRVALCYEKALKDVDCLRLPVEPEGCSANYQSYSVFLKENCPVRRDDLMRFLLNEGIATRPGIMNAHETTAYRAMFPGVRLPISEELSARSLLLPFYVPMKEEDVGFVTQKIKEALRS